MSYERLGRGKKYTKEFFSKQMLELYGSIILTQKSDFHSIKQNVTVFCKKHNLEITDTPYKFFTSFCCPECHKEKTEKRKTERFINKAEIVHGDTYDYSLVEYKTTRDKIKIICKIHGVFEQQPDSHLQNHGCPKCAKEYVLSFRRLTKNEFVERSKAIHDDKYDYSLVVYKNNSTPVKIICPIHGVFKQKPVCHLNMKHGCRKCAGEASSPAELKIENWLQENDIEHKTQVWFDACRGKKRPLPFDFAIYNNEKLSLLIEFDGAHHFREYSHFGGKEAFEERKRLDKIKDDFCFQNNIPLLRIPYWEFDNFKETIRNKIKEVKQCL